MRKIKKKSNEEIFECDYVNIAEEIVKILKRENVIRPGGRTPFQKVETLLYNYENFKSAVENKRETIEHIRKFGINKNSPGFSGFGGSGEFKSDLEKSEEQIAELERSIVLTESVISLIEDCLLDIEKDKYFDLIKLKYFDGETTSEIADYFSCDLTTVNRNKNRLIEKIQMRLFSDEVIRGIFAF